MIGVEQTKISTQIMGELKDNKIISSNANNTNAKMVYIEPGKISNFDKGYYYIKDEDDRRNIKYFDYSAMIFNMFFNIYFLFSSNKFSFSSITL